MDALKELSSLANKAKLALHPNVPPHYLPLAKYSDKTANELTKAIVHFIRFKGGYAARINVQGQYSEKLGKWVKSGSTKGTSDILACLNGTFLAIEVKHGKDRQSDVQIQTQKQVEAAGGIYIIAGTYQEFYDKVIQLKEAQS